MMQSKLQAARKIAALADANVATECSLLEYVLTAHGTGLDKAARSDGLGEILEAKAVWTILVQLEDKE